MDLIWRRWSLTAAQAAVLQLLARPAVASLLHELHAGHGLEELSAGAIQNSLGSWTPLDQWQHTGGHLNGGSVSSACGFSRPGLNSACSLSAR